MGWRPLSANRVDAAARCSISCVFRLPWHPFPDWHVQPEGPCCGRFQLAAPPAHLAGRHVLPGEPSAHARQLAVAAPSPPPCDGGAAVAATPTRHATAATTAPLQEEEFWAGRLAALTKASQQMPLQPPCSSSDASTAGIPAYLPPASPAQLPLAAPPQQAAGTLVCPPAGPADALVQQAQVEALKLQVAQLRRSNVQLQQQVAAAAAERAAAAKSAALQRLAELRLPGHEERDAAATEAAAVNEGAVAATLAALRAELDVQLQPEAESVPMGHLLQLYARFQSRLADLGQRHEAALQQRQEEQEKQLLMQVGGWVGGWAGSFAGALC